MQWIKDRKLDLLDWPARSQDRYPVKPLEKNLVRRICADCMKYTTDDNLK